MELPFKTESYSLMEAKWPSKGKVILASLTKHGKDDQDTIILYQAYKHSIANYAVAHQTFKGCPDFSTTRMTWLKPNFLWMMFRSGWASKKDQERILAISVTKEGFKEILRNSTSTKLKEIPSTEVDVRLQWDPDHNPLGDKLERRAIQLGIRGRILESFLNEWIVKIDDITEFVNEQRIFVEKKEFELLQVPAEIEFDVEDDDLRKHIQLDAN